MPPFDAQSADFSARLLTWYDNHGRKSLPWQLGRDPYPVWLSEIMLQQTQVTAVIPYFTRFLARFPDVQTLAESAADDVMHHWSGLGYYARARNLHKAASVIMEQHNGVFPDTLEQVMALPGIGRSTAGAILAFCFGHRQPILDGNVKRVLTRAFAIQGYPAQRETQAKLWQLADQLTPLDRVENYTQAIMDLGATLCTRSSPDCARCPLSATCTAYIAGNPSTYPHRKPKKERPHREATMLLLENAQGQILLTKRPPTGIWGGLWSFPELPENARLKQYMKQQFGVTGGRNRKLPDLHHGFTHFDLTIHPRHIEVLPSSNRIMDAEQYLWYNPNQPQSVGLPAAISKLLRDLTANSQTKP